MSSNFTAGAKCARHIKHPCRRDPTVRSDEAGHTLLLRSLRAGRDRAHRGASGRCTGTGGVGARGVPVAVSFPSCLPRHGRRDAARTDAEAAIGACGVEAERQGARGHGDCLRCGLRDARGVHARVPLQLQHVAVRLQVAEVPADRDRRVRAAFTTAPTVRYRNSSLETQEDSPWTSTSRTCPSFVSRP